MEEEHFIDFTRARQRQNGRIQYSRDELLEIGRKPGLSALPAGINMSVIRELEELTFFDSGPKPDWGKDKGYGRLDFLRPGGGLGGPIRSRLVGDGSLPEELPPARSLEPHAAPRPSEGLDIRRASSWRPPPEAGGQTPPGDRWNGPVTPGRRPGEEYPARRGRWDEAKAGTTPERDTWRSTLQSPSNGEERSWRGPSPGGAPPGTRPPGPPGRWGEEERPRGAGRGPRGSLEERELPRRPPPGMGHEDKWTRGGPPPGGWEHERDREWVGRREGGYGGPVNWDRDPSWMHDGQQPGDAAGAARMPPPPARAGAMTAKDIEKERQEMQAQWRAQAAANKANEEDDLAFLRSDSDEDEPSGIRPPVAAHQETAGSHPSRSRFFDVPSGDITTGGNHHQQQQQPSTPSGDPSVVGRKLTFDQFKAAAAGGGSGPAAPSAGEQPLQHQGSGAAAHAKAVTLAEVERQVSGGPLQQLQQQPPPPPPPSAGPAPAAAALPPPGASGADKRVDTEASRKLMAFLKKPAAIAAAPQVLKPPPGMGFASPTAAPVVEKQLAPSGLPAAVAEPPAANSSASASSGLKHAATPASEPAACHEADNVDDLAKLAGLLDLGLEEDTAASGLAAKLASLAKGDPEVAFGGKRDSATGLSPTLGGFGSVLGGSKQVPSALAGIWGTGLGVWDHAPKSTGAGPSLLPAGTTPFAAAAGAVAAGPTAASTAAAGPPLGDGMRAPALGQGVAGFLGVATGVSGPPSAGAGGVKSPATVHGAAPGTAPGTNALAQLLASAAAGAQGAARPPTASMPFTSGPAGPQQPGMQQPGMQQPGLGQTGMGPAAVGQMGGIARPQVPGAVGYGAAGPGSGSGGLAASNPLAMLFAGQAKQVQQQQQQAQQQAMAAGLPGVGAGTAARPPGVNLPAQQLLHHQQQQQQQQQQQGQGQQQSNLAGLMQHLQQQQAQQQAMAAGRAGMTLQQAQHQQQLQQQQAQQRAAAAAALTHQQQQQQLLGAARPQQTQPNLQYLLHQQQQQAQLRQQQQQQQQLMLAQQLAQNQAVQAASLAARSAAMGGGMPPNQFMQGAAGQLPPGFGGMPAAQRPGMPQGFGMAQQDQQAQLRQLLSQAQQRVPGMPGMS